MTAPQYVTLLMNWVQEQLDDEAIFPTGPQRRPLARAARWRVCARFLLHLCARFTRLRSSQRALPVQLPRRGRQHLPKVRARAALAA